MFFTKLLGNSHINKISEELSVFLMYLGAKLCGIFNEYCNGFNIILIF